MNNTIDINKLRVWPYNFLYKILDNSIIAEMDSEIANQLIEDMLPDPRKKAIIVMRYRDKLSYGKIGESLEITAGNVREHELRIINHSKHNDAIKKVMIKLYSDPKDIPLAYTSLDLKECRAINRNRIYTVGQLLTYTKKDLCRMYNVGQKTVDHVVEMLNGYGFTLVESV